MNQKQKTIFVDRDGTLIEEVNFLSRLEDLRFFPYTREAVELLKKAGFLIVVVTNQSGIARKVFEEAAMHSIHEQIQADLPEKLDAFYYCPHMPNDGCACRKPNTGMIEAARAEFPIDLEKSWMIGDKALDIELGFNAGIKTAMVLTGYGRGDIDKLERKPDIVAETLIDAVKLIVSYDSQPAGDNK
ncbi:MAG: histidinol-phosphate phosphatase family protein [Acidobacteria bacterium]|jgi:D-glycero-D-manno-heptose 1,7-bisphosphate phosphatase|nr:histidinol-phosphate phosphatase family protein [Acidobacteriota bacterium]